MTFAAVAALLGLAAAAALLAGFRLLRGSPPGAGDRWTGAGRLLAGLAVPALAAGVYLLVGRPELASLSPDETGPAEIAALEEALARDPGDIDGWRLLASSLGEEGRHAEAAEAWKRAGGLLGDGDADTLVHAAESLILAAEGEVTDEARSLVERALGLDPAHVQGRFYAGLAMLRGGEPGEALRGWDALLEETPADAPYRPMIEAGIREAAAAAGVPSPLPEPEAPVGGERIRAMVDGLAARLAESPDDIEGWKRLGRSRRVLEEPVAAYEAYETALGIDPDDAEALAGAAEARLFAAIEADGAPDEAVALLRRLIEIDPDHALALFVLGEDAALRGEPERARALFERLLGRLPEGSPERDAVRERLAALDGEGG